MGDFRDQYKEKPFGFRGVKESRQVRVEKCMETRKHRRSKDFNKNRDVTHPTTSTSKTQAARTDESIIKEDRLTRFKKWKAEKERQKEKEKNKKKPFTVGIMHHRIYSPALNQHNGSIAGPSKPKVHENVEPKPPVAKKISKATEKRLKAKAMQEKVKLPQKISKPPKKPVEKAPRMEESLAPTDYKFKAPTGVLEMPLFGKSIITPTDKQIMNFALSPLKRRSLARRASTTAFVVESIYSHENIGPENAGYLTVENSMDQEDSVETITLRFSCDSSASQNSPVQMQQSPRVSLQFDASSSKSRRSCSNDLKLNRSIEEVTGEYPDVSLNASRKRVYNSTENKDILANTDTTLLNTTFEYETNEPLNVSGSGKSEGILNSSANEKTPTGNSTREPGSNASADSWKSNTSSDPAIFSPYIVSSRGKSKARKEEQIRRGLGRSPGDGIPTKNTVMQECLNMSIEDEERTAQYFYFLLNKETERLEELCRQWEAIKVEPGVTEDAQYLINQATGQTNLLLKKKFERFHSLVRDCESGKGEMLVTCKDLQGFWDMMYMEVKNCDERFQKLEKRRSENWAEEKPEIARPVSRKKTAGKKKVVASKPSGIRALIMAARREKQLCDTQSDSDKADSSKSEDSSPLNNDGLNESGSSAVSNNTRKSISARGDGGKQTPAKRESTRMSLLQKVQLSETTKKIRSPLAIMKISKMCKTPDFKSEEVKKYPTVEQTPGKSILKKSRETKDLNSSVKLTHKVNFDDNVTLKEVPVDEEVRAKLDLAAALERLDSFDFDTSREQVELAVERKLNFDSDSSDEPENILDKIEKQELQVNTSVVQVPLLKISEATPMKNLRRRSTAPSLLEHSARTPLRTRESPENRDQTSSIRRSQLSRQNPVDEDADNEEEHDQKVRILRNRTISTQEPPRTPKTPRRKASMTAPSSEQKENATPSSRRRKGSLKVTIQDERPPETDFDGATDLISLNQNGADKPKRPSRFSVKYSETECSGCVDQRPAYPVTPHATRSKLQSSEKKRRSRPSESTTSLDTPKKLPV